MNISELALAPRAALADLREGLRRYRTALLFGFQEIAQRYRRSRVGAFWLTINQAILIAALGTVFGALFGVPISIYLPHVACGLIFWGYISTVVQEGSKCFISAQNMILQVRMPLFTHALRMFWRETIILAHNLVIVPIVLLIFLKNPGWPVVLFPIGFVLVALNLFWIILVAGTICTRYRDLPQIIQNVIQVMFYLTPVMWSEDLLPQHLHFLLTFNPFYHMMSLLRGPLVGAVPSLESYAIVAALAVAGWVLAIYFFGRYKWRIPYWL